MRWWSHVVSPLLAIPLCLNPTSNQFPYFIVLAPEHAKMLANAGWEKNDFRQGLWKSTRVPLSEWSTGDKMCGIAPVPKELQPATSETLIPITPKPEDIDIIVAGGPGKHSQYFIPGHGIAIRKRIDPWK